MRSKAAALTLAVAFALAILAPSLANGHPERATVFPDLHVGNVPNVRHSGKALYVCRPESAGKIRRIFDGRRERGRLRMLEQCGYANIQTAIDDAESGYRIRILPGTYKEMPSRRVPVGSFGEGPCPNDYVETEGFTNSAPPPIGPRSNDPPVRPDRNFQVNCPNSKNLIEVVGDPRPEPDPTDPIAPVCLQLCNLQIEGLGSKPQQVKIVGDRQKLDVLRIDRADGIVIRNLLVEQSAFNGIDVVETNGFRIEDVIARWNQDYGVLTFTGVHGLYNRVRAYGNGDSGVYPGSNQKGCDPVGDYAVSGDGTCGSDPGSREGCGTPTTEIRNSISSGNVLGYSGTAGNSTYLHDNKFFNNSTGLSTDSFAAGHPGMPQECVLWEDNEIYSNNNNPFTAERQQFCTETPFAERDKKIVCPQFQVPVGTGMIIAGGNRDLIRDNRIYDNWRFGVLTFAVPAALRGDTDPAHQQDTGNGVEIVENSFGVGPGGDADPNGLDLQWDGSGIGNCEQGNSGPGGSAAGEGPSPLPACPGSSLPGVTNPVVVAPLVSCAAWDPENLHMPPGCDWFVTPAEPQP